jgi:hypothetical protein
VDSACFKGYTVFYTLKNKAFKTHEDNFTGERGQPARKNFASHVICKKTQLPRLS